MNTLTAIKLPNILFYAKYLYVIMYANKQTSPRRSGKKEYLMGKIKIPIIITLCVLIMFILTGYLFFRKDSSRSKPLHTDRDTVAASVVSGSAISKSVEKSGNYIYSPTYEYDDSDNNEDNKEDHMQINEPTKLHGSLRLRWTWTPKALLYLLTKNTVFRRITFLRIW